MPIDFEPMRNESSANYGAVFLSGSIPTPERWDGYFDALEITDAVVAFARACLTSGFSIITAAHPTIAPLLLYVAAEFPDFDHPRVRIYQSTLFQEVLPTATRRFEADGVGELIWTEAAHGDEPSPGKWDASLLKMRHRMLEERDLRAAVFIGGMSGITDEYDLFREMHPGRPTYAARRPGGEAAKLNDPSELWMGDQGASYPAVWRRFLKGAPLL